MGTRVSPLTPEDIAAATAFEMPDWRSELLTPCSAQLKPTPARVIPRSWHEAWLEKVAPGRFSDVPDLTTGRWPTACDDRHVWTLATVQGTREVATVCTRRAHHTGRHAAGAFGRTIAVWEYPR